MSLRSYSDVPNRVINFFLQEAGAEYDRNRGLAPYKRLTADVREFFGDACAYCGGTDSLVEDHVVPRNRTNVGLHAWGNVVPACRDCNRLKKGNVDWRTHLNAVEPDVVRRQARADRIEEFRQRYRYEPDVEPLRAVLQSLYQLADRHTRSLVAFAVTASQPYISGMHRLEQAGLDALASVPDNAKRAE